MAFKKIKQFFYLVAGHKRKNNSIEKHETFERLSVLFRNAIWKTENWCILKFKTQPKFRKVVILQ